MLNIDEPENMQPKIPLFRLGFRPFFLFGSLFSIISLAFWILSLKGEIAFTPQGNTLWWHGHEMIFGFVSVIVVGFLLTAVQNWTGRPGLKGLPLIGLFILWLLARILLINQDWSSLEFAAIVDLLFLPFSAFVMANAVVPLKQWRNFGFVPILLSLTIANACSYYGLITHQPDFVSSSLYAAVIIITVVVALIGGRVIPFFTDRASGWERLPSIDLLEKLTFISLALLAISFIFQLQVTTKMFAFISGIVLLVRWNRWGWQHTFKTPLLWSLHLSYLFIPIGLVLLATDFPRSAGLHAITVGGMGGMILAMMARVSLGHTGRKLEPPKLVVLGFALMIIATICRIGANLLPNLYPQLLGLTVLLWLLAFTAFVICYGPMLCQIRADGRPG
ncbi:NnrS family protein [Shewanella sp. 202IG2-18]|uniref:NnrS family protein n=1 Tax=Parashewanella hymeniacidonis TaxID=2807618 RepID=UPI001960E06F|nr:NnrS family protein [Parashewanella hymeniacidonis]MBM7074502.1 NnrS family protein [Parashewanella hymeniacidonis]